MPKNATPANTVRLTYYGPQDCWYVTTSYDGHKVTANTVYRGFHQDQAETILQAFVKVGFNDISQER